MAIIRNEILNRTFSVQTLDYGNIDGPGSPANLLKDGGKNIIDAHWQALGTSLTMDIRL